MQKITHLPSLPPRPVDGHKGLFGRVLIVGGNDEMLGAPVLAGTSALRSGSGLVQIAVPKSILPMALSVTPELIGLGLEEDQGFDRLDDAAGKADVIVLGPGLGRSSAAESRVHRLIQLDKPMVLDADALNILASASAWPTEAKCRAVLTPHPGEMSRLARLFGKSEVPIDEAGRMEIATQAAQAFKQVIVLKGTGTVITDGDRCAINPTGDSSLSKAGTGDVLSGVIGSLLGQKMEPFEAAVAAAWIHGRAGELAGIRQGMRCALAMDVVTCLPLAFAEYEQGKEGFGLAALAKARAKG